MSYLGKGSIGKSIDMCTVAETCNSELINIYEKRKKKYSVDNVIKISN